MQIYEILCEDNGKLVVQIFLSRIIIVCLEICVKWHIPVCFHIKSPTPYHHMEYNTQSILMTLYAICYGVTPVVFSGIYLTNLNNSRF